MATHLRCVVDKQPRIYNSRYPWLMLMYIVYNKPTRCNFGSIVFIKNYKYALHVSDALCVHHQDHYKLQQQPLVFVMSWDGLNPV